MLPVLCDALETGSGGRLARWATPLWTWTAGRSVARPVVLPAGCRAVAVGGATLGGSGKTPVAIACAAHLAASGVRTALVGHAYRAGLEHALEVSGREPVELVGDEALVAAVHLARAAAHASGGGRTAARVVVGPTRAKAVALAARMADVLVFDGVGQTAPDRCSLALLAVDGAQPWGRAVSVPPGGDLRAPRPVLVSACDAIVPVVDSAAGSGSIDPGRPSWPAVVRSHGVRLRAGGGADALAGSLPAAGGHASSCEDARDGAGAWVPWSGLTRLRVGAILAVARSERVLRFLARRGVAPVAVVRMRDHGPFGARARSAWRRAERAHRVDLWLTTAKCHWHLPRSIFAAPLGVIDYGLDLAPSLRQALDEAASR